MVCMITDGRMAISAAALAAAARAGVDLIQIREPGMDDSARLTLVRDGVAACSGTATRVLVNDRLDLALAAGASGVHLTGTSFPASRARTLAPSGWVIGRSVHDLDEAIEAVQDGGCDYLLFGTVFASGSKPEGHRVAGIEALRALCAAVPLPVLAIGGITAANAALAAEAGAAGVAGISLFSTADSIEAVVGQVRRAFSR